MQILETNDARRFRRALKILWDDWPEAGENWDSELGTMSKLRLERRVTPRKTNSMHWKEGRAVKDRTTCKICLKADGKIYPIEAKPDEGPLLHPNCRCYFNVLHCIESGTATDKGEDGADYWLLHNGKLPDYYISKEEAEELGWVRKKGNLAEVAPGLMIFANYRNNREKLPTAPGRVWYEADINYMSGYRNSARVFFSNDGLLFVSYNHAETFSEICK